MGQKDKLLGDSDYMALASFRHAIRRFQAFSEEKAIEVGLTPQQHQALLAIRGCPPDEATVGHVAERLILKLLAPSNAHVWDYQVSPGGNAQDET